MVEWYTRQGATPFFEPGNCLAGARLQQCTVPIQGSRGLGRMACFPSEITSSMRGSQLGWRVGVDIGGTFTDVALIDEEIGGIGIAKVPTTTQDFTEGVTSPALRRAWRGCGASRGDALKRARVVSVRCYALRGVAQAQELFTPEPGFILPQRGSDPLSHRGAAVLLIADQLAREP